MTEVAKKRSRISFSSKPLSKMDPHEQKAEIALRQQYKETEEAIAGYTWEKRWMLNFRTVPRKKKVISFRIVNVILRVKEVPNDRSKHSLETTKH